MKGKDFVLLFVSLLTTLIVKNGHILKSMIVKKSHILHFSENWFKIKLGKTFNTKFRFQWKD